MDEEGNGIPVIIVNTWSYICITMILKVSFYEVIGRGCQLIRLKPRNKPF